MTWRNWSFIIVLILLNYIVFSILGSYVFVPTADSTSPTATPQPTFTPGARVLTQVPPLPYTFLTPSPLPGSTRATATTIAPTPSRAP